MKPRWDVAVHGDVAEWRHSDGESSEMLAIPLREFITVANMVRPYLANDTYGGGVLRLSWDEVDK